MPDACVIDTDVVSYLFRRDTRAQVYQPYLTGAEPFVSFMTIAELERWALQRNWGTRRRAELETFLASFTLVMPDRVMCRLWAEVSDGGRRRGRPIAVADAWIAATAIAYGLPLVTHDRDDFAGVPGLIILPDAGS